MSGKHPFILRLLIAQLAIIIFGFALTPTFAQSAAAKDANVSGEEKAEQVLKRAIEALGGANYLNVHTVVSRGRLTPFQDGISGLPTAFLDYIAYPNRERTEYRSKGGRVIQVNDGDGGWVFDGASRTIKDMAREQVEEYLRFTLKTSVEYLLRGGWRKEGAKLAYVGRREAGIARRNEVVRLTYADGMSVEFEFGAKDGLPAKVLYQRKNAEGEEAPEEDRLAQHIPVGGVVAPFVIDHYRAGVQAYRINYESIEFNVPVAEALFARPANAKAVK
ncbi:MAG TPA: hypothetical protein VM911_00325 [Pyrinomonadaceae bacterium]|nr:hypothetical protein [Pyrinomonadaceae bacterium]